MAVAEIISAINSPFFRELLDGLTDGVYLTDTDRNIMFWNKSAKNITGFSSADIIGKKCCDNILIHVDDKGEKQCNGTCPLFETIKTGEDYKTEQLFLHHKNGHRIPVLINVIPLKNSDGKVIGAAEVFNDLSAKVANLEKIDELKKLILFDTLTQIGNRRYVEMNLFTRFAEFKRYNMPFGILFIDLDDFKNANDNYGHDIGDKVLRMVAKTLVKNIRPFDIIGRWGGEEFIAVIVNINEEQLSVIAEKLRILVEKSILFISPDLIKTTVSIGATIATMDDTIDTIVRRADHLMYQSKNSGKNRVTFG